MTDREIRGTIFLSHASSDKGFVERVNRGLDRAITFYDINTIEPGQETIEAMKRGISRAAVFVLFHSIASQTAWVEFEKSLAEIQIILNPSTKILVCPIGGSDYRTLPPWMKRYMTTTEEFKPRDIVRSIQFLHEKSFNETFPESRWAHPGREALKREITLSIMRASAETGKVLSALVLAGVQGMGRGTLAAELVLDSYPGMRPAGPVFDLPAAGDAVDWHLRFFEDLNEGLSDIEAAAQIEAFGKLPPVEQAKTLFGSLKHWGKLNQVITIRNRWGLRDKGNTIRPWLLELLRLLQSDPSIRLILVSERQLPRAQVDQLENLRQFHLEELDNQTIQFILAQRIEPRFLDAQRLPTIATLVSGHPATANHTARLVNGGRSIESLLLATAPVAAFQDAVLAELFESGTLSSLQKQILKLLSWFPKLSVSLIAEVFSKCDASQLIEELWELVDFSLIDQTEMGRYKTPAVVSSTYRRRHLEDDAEISDRVSRIISKQFDDGVLDFDLIESLLVAIVSSGTEISERLLKLLTPARLAPVVEKEYYEGHGSVGEQSRVHYRQCYSLAKLALVMKASDDNLENILFYGGDACVRLGNYPEDIIEVMRTKGFMTVDYIVASHLFHTKHDFESAAQVLSRSLVASRFRIRNVRLLARIYLRDGKFTKALETLEKVVETRLLRDTGLMLMKVKALRGTRNSTEASRLLSRVRDNSDDYGDYAIYQASASLRSGRYPEALQHIERAKKAPRANQAVLNFLQCACEVESGNNESLGVACALARSMNRESDALQLQARAALVAGDWNSAKGYISQVIRKDWFDLNVEFRALEVELADPAVQRDPVARAKALERREIILRLSTDSVEGSNYA